MKKTRKSIHFSFFQSIILIILCIVSLFSFVSPQIIFNSSAEETYSTVLDDLQKDPNFNVEDYPVVEDDYSLDVITIAEGSDWELYVYVYQPSATLLATSINISTGINENLDFKNYKLTLIDNNQALYKYQVTDFVVSHDLTRYYEITSIYRAFDENIDKPIEGQEIGEVNYDISKLWTFTTNDSGIELNVEDIDTIEIVSKYVGFIRYSEPGIWPFWSFDSGCDRHFVAFTTDKDIDRLLEADIYYETQSAHFRDYAGGSFYEDTWYFGEIEEGYKYLTYEQTGNYEGLGGVDWSRIQTVDEFVKTVNIEHTYTQGIFDVEYESQLTEEGFNDIKDQKWVLNFLETEYDYDKSMHEENTYTTRVSNVSILRLKFETDGFIYDLGVIDNKQSGDGKPDNVINVIVQLAEWVKWLLIILGIILIVVIILACLSLIAPLSTIFSFLWTCIKAVFKALWWLIKKIAIGVWWVVTAPFEVFND